jgi:hypothetical protein
VLRFDDLSGERQAVNNCGVRTRVGECLVQEENGSLEAIAMAERSSRSVRTWNNSSAARHAKVPWGPTVWP